MREPTEDDQFRRNLELERQTEYAFYEQEIRMQELEKRMKAEEEARKKEEKHRKEEEKHRKEEEKLRKEEEKRRKESEKQADIYKQEKESAYEKLRDYAKLLKNSGKPLREIVEMTGLSKQEIQSL